MLTETFSPSFLRQLELLRLKARREFLGTGQGSHLSRKRGQGMAFSDYRKYELGDSPRRIDWGLFARSERLYVKEFQEEQELSVLICLDASRSMANPPEDGKWRYAVDLALALAYVSLMQHDHVRASVPGLVSTPLFKSPRQFHQLGKLLYDAPPGAGTELHLETARLAGSLRFPGIAIVLSDYMFPLEQLEKIFLPLRARNFEIIALQVLGASELDPAGNLDGGGKLIDSESSEEIALQFDDETAAAYERLFSKHQAALASFCAANGIRSITASCQRPLQEFVTQQLPKIGLLR